MYSHSRAITILLGCDVVNCIICPAEMALFAVFINTSCQGNYPTSWMLFLWGLFSIAISHYRFRRAQYMCESDASIYSVLSMQNNICRLTDYIFVIVVLIGFFAEPLCIKEGEFLGVFSIVMFAYHLIMNTYMYALINALCNDEYLIANYSGTVSENLS